MKEGDLVFAPFKEERAWPGKIMKMGMMADIKFFKVRDPLKVPASSMVPFSLDKMAYYLNKHKDKVFVAAIKAAEKEFKG
jgi:hypothetical protein